MTSDWQQEQQRAADDWLAQRIDNQQTAEEERARLRQRHDDELWNHPEGWADAPS